MDIDIEILRDRLYASSPHDLGSDDDNMYRVAIDQGLSNYK